MLSRPRATCLFALLTFVFAAPAAAQDEVISESVAPVGVEKYDQDQSVDARYWLWGTSADLPNFDFGEDPRASALYQRLNLDLDVTFGSLGARLDVDMLTGRLTGDPVAAESAAVPDETNSGSRPRGEVTDVENILEPRNAYLRYRSPVGELRLGLQTSNFGLGLVANDGEPDDWDLFNQPYGGDRGLRALFATKPLGFLPSHTLSNIYLAVGADVVYRDDNGAYIDGDRAQQFITSIFYQGSNANNPRESSFLGAYFAARTQEDDDGDQLDALAFDISGRQRWYVNDRNWHLNIGAEAALLTGETTRAYSFTGQPKTNILGVGAAAEASARWIPMQLAFEVLAGFAQGDADADDDTLYRFRFDPNYKVGLVLFDHYLPAVTRASYRRATDPTRSGQPPKGIEGFVNDGAVENAIYVNPRIYFGDPEGLLTGVGFLWAAADEPLADPFETFESGGARVGINGAPASTDLGFEVDVAARYRYRIWRQLRAEAKVEYGVFFPGEAFDDVSGAPADPKSLIRGRIALLW